MCTEGCNQQLNGGWSDGGNYTSRKQVGSGQCKLHLVLKFTSPFKVHYGKILDANIEVISICKQILSTVFITRAFFTKLTKLSCGKHWQKGCNGFYCLNHTAPWQHYSLTQLNHIAGQLGLHIQKQCIEESEKKICKHPHYLTPC